MKPIRKAATYDDLRRVPEPMVAEIVDGDLFASPRPSSPHARAATVLGGELFGSFDRPPGASSPGGWWVLFEPELHLATDVLVPDLAAWRRERLPSIPNVAAFEIAPDWVCEVISPQTASLDRIRKMRCYAREHVSHLWLVDPAARTVEVYRLEGGRWVVSGTYGDADRVRAEPFEAVEIDLSRLWI